MLEAKLRRPWPSVSRRKKHVEAWTFKAFGEGNSTMPKRQPSGNIFVSFLHCNILSCWLAQILEGKRENHKLSKGITEHREGFAGAFQLIYIM